MNVVKFKKKRQQNWFSKLATETYYELKRQQELRLDEWANGYGTETDYFYENLEKKVLFKDVLIMMRGMSRSDLANAA